MTRTENTLASLPKVDICSQADLDEWKHKRPTHTYRDMHVSFVCVECNNVRQLRLKAITAYPIICRNCRYRHRYDDPAYIEKMKLTNKRKYGVEYNSQTKEWRESVNRTSLEKFGVDHFSKNKEVREKITNSTIERYGGIGFAAPDLLDKQRQTMIDKYNAYHNMVVPELKEKFFAQILDKYGGIGNGSKEILQKQQSTMVAVYGVTHLTQSAEYYAKWKKKYLYNGIYFDSLPEIDYYIKLTDAKANFEYHPNVKFEYQYDGKTHYYFPDFSVDGELIELKGPHFFTTKDIDSPDAHMINPYNRQLDGIADAKFKCMRLNNVKIIITTPLKKLQTFINMHHIVERSLYDSK